MMFYGNIDIPFKGGLVLVLEGFDYFSLWGKEAASIVLDLLANLSREYILTGQRLIVLVQTDNPSPDLQYLKVGACPVIFNSREWLDSKRGL